MYKCSKCGFEFDGNFCPRCGEKRPDNKRFPHCGNVIVDDDQNNIDLQEIEQGGFVRNINNSQNVKTKIGKFLSYTPMALCGLFVILAFAFMFGKIYEVNSIFIFEANTYNVWQVGELKEVPVLFYPCMCYMISSIIGLVVLLPVSIKAFKDPEDYFNHEGSHIVLYFAEYALCAIASVVIMIGVANEGEGLMKPGACPILFLTFSLIFAALTVVCLLLRKFFFKGTISPKINERNLQISTIQGKKEKKNKRAMIVDTVAAIALLIGILGGVLLYLNSDYLELRHDIFNTETVELIGLDYGKNNVRDLLGEPDEISGQDSVWEYGDDNLLNYIDKVTQKTEAQERALMQGDFQKVNDLQEEINKLNESVKNKKFKYIRIVFSDNKIVSVLFDKQYSLVQTSSKSLKNCRFVDGVYGFYYWNGINDKNVFLTGSIEYNAAYAAYFTDGSYYMARMKNYTVDNTYGMIKWSDQFCEYSRAYEMNREVGNISSKGVWRKGNSVFPSSLNNIQIPQGVTIIGEDAFSGCRDLTSIEIPDSVTSIGSYAFSGCFGLTSIEIAQGVTSIGAGAFYDCYNIMSIIIPAGVTSIGEKAFSGCSSLDNVYYKGTSDQWSNISIENHNVLLSAANRYYFSQNDPYTSGTAEDNLSYWHYSDDGETIMIWDK